MQYDYKIPMTICVSRGIGHTPLVKLGKKLYAKLESVNPSGSIKDRMACYILDKAEQNGEIQQGGVIVEATSGNTGIAFSMLAAERGYRMIVVLPSNMSEERKQLIRAFGAEIVEVGPGDFLGAVRKRDSLIKKYNAFNPDQFVNPMNIECHRKTTGQEILWQVEKLPGNLHISAFVAGVGTGGSLMGIRSALIEKFPKIEIIAVEPTESAVMSHGEPGVHQIQGIGDGFIPEIMDMDTVNEVITVSSKDAIHRTKELAKKMGLLVGISSGANVVAAEKYIEKKNPSGLVITLLPDRQERYLSMLW